MGPLFSGVLMLILGAGLSLILFFAASIVNNRSQLQRSRTKLAFLAILASASFWIGGGTCGIIAGSLMANHGALESRTAVFSFFGISFLGGLVIAASVGRMYWKSTSRS